MPELELLRRHYPEPSATDAEARERARAALLARIEAAAQTPRERRSSRIDAPARPPLLRRVRLSLALAGATAAAAVAGAVFVDPGGPDGGGTASAATRALRDAARVARSQPLLVLPRDGRYLYVRSVEAYLSVSDIGVTVLEPRVRESWLRPQGGRTRVSYRKAEFLTRADRLRWDALGLPRPRRPRGPRLLHAPAPERLDLPSDPDELFERLESQARGHSEGIYRELFTLVGDGLLDPAATTPAQRAALYEVAARIPGVELIGRVRDRAGRRGVAVAIRNEPDGTRDTLIFDPRTSALLGEEQVALPGNGFGYPAGRAIAYATYSAAVVDSVGRRPGRR